MGEHSAELTANRSRSSQKRPRKPTATALARRLLKIIVYEKRSRIGGKLTLDDLEPTEVGDWKMPDFRAACAYAAARGWLVVQDDVLTLAEAGLEAA